MSFCAPFSEYETKVHLKTIINWIWPWVSDYESDEKGALDDYYYNDGDDVADEGLVEVVEVVEKVVEREEGESVDGAVGEGAGEGGEKKANEPFAVPTASAFYTHDDRRRNSSGGGGGGRNR
nr:hypothetical protein [Tanacetum cinerariifolium]